MHCVLFIPRFLCHRRHQTDVHCWPAGISAEVQSKSLALTSKMTNFPSVAVIVAFYVLGALSASLPVVTPRPQLNASVDEHYLLRQRAITTEMSTCGYENGDPSSIRTANSGYDCRVDTVRALWGFCPTTVTSASDCGLAGYCVDTGSCSDGCGSLSGVSTITTFTWCVLSVPALSCDATNSKTKH